MPGKRTLVNSLTDSIHTSISVSNIDQYEPENSICENTILASKIAERVAQALLAAGASVDAVYEEGDTPLHYAARQGDADGARALLEAGASVDAANNYRRTPLVFAVRRKKYNVVRVLLKAGANRNRLTDAQNEWIDAEERDMLMHNG
jgi:ankyrin repeat protein